MKAMQATMQKALKVTRTADYAAPPEKVWAAIGDFCGISNWHPAIEKCVLSKEGGKPIRTLSLKGGGTIVEDEVSRSNDKMEYTYTILESPLPLSDYEATIAVTPSGTGSRVIWWSEFNARGATNLAVEKIIGGIFEAGLKGLGEKVT